MGAIMKRLLVLITLTMIVGAEMFTSLAHLEQILHTERELATDINSYINNEQMRLDKLRTVASEFLAHSKEALSKKEKYLGNPVNAYLLLKKFTLEWNDIKTHYIEKTAQNLLNDRLAERQFTLPGTEDLSGAVSAVLRLQDTYNLSAEQFADGDFLGNTTADIMSPKLSSLDCFIFGQDAYNKQDYYHGIVWLEEALKRHDPNDKINSPKKELIIDYLAYAVYRQGDLTRAHKLTLDLLDLTPDNERARGNLEYFKYAMSESGNRPHYQTLDQLRFSERQYKTSDEYVLYEALCRGEEVNVKKSKKKLSCRYVDNGHPLLLLQPVKEETINHKPWLVMYHDVIPEPYMNRIKELAAPRLGRATVQNPLTGKLEFADYRISKSAWLKNHMDPIIEKTCNIIEAVTNLTMSTAEELQVANYGIGGQYEPHFDYARRSEPEAFKDLGTGNRMATWLLYMSDVHAGGATVFPYIGVKIFPKKGAAAFWHNLHRNGEGDELTRHAACPVLAGTKWVSNKWIHEKGQEFRRPCALDPKL